MVNVNDIMITSVEEIHVFDLSGEKWLFDLNELQNVTIATSEEKEDIVGKKGRKLTTMKKNKSAVVSGSNGVVSGGLMAVQTGGEFENGKTTVLWSESLFVKSSVATTNWTAIGTTGNEIKEVHVKDSATGVITNVLTQDASVGSGKFTYDPATKGLKFDSGDVADGAEIVVHYNRYVEGSVLKNMNDKFSAKCMMIVDAMGEDKCSNVYHVQYVMPKVDFSGEFSQEMGDGQTMHNFEAECLPGACSANGELWTYTVFGVNAADVAA